MFDLAHLFITDVPEQVVVSVNHRARANALIAAPNGFDTDLALFFDLIFGSHIE